MGVQEMGVWANRRISDQETGAVGPVFPETKRGIGTVRTLCQEPKAEPDWESRMGGFQEGGFRNNWLAAFSLQGNLLLQGKPYFNSVQNRCIVKGEAQKSPLFWWFSGGFWFSQDRLFSRNSTRKPLNLIKDPRFLQTPLVKPLVFTMHTVDYLKLTFRLLLRLRVWGQRLHWKNSSTNCIHPKTFKKTYHGPRNYYVNNSQGNKSCNCICNLPAKIIL